MPAGFFAALGVFGLMGMVALALQPMPVAEGAAGFLVRGLVWPSAAAWFWTLVQAVGSLLAITLMVRGYQMTKAATASVFEYLVLPASAFWTWLIWGEALGAVALTGMALIAVAGVAITRTAR